MTVREITEQTERVTLSEHACFSAESAGRLIFEEKCPLRTEFQRDRDRIIHSSFFRRLKHKTQVFISPEGDHYRTRLTHTLEVSQIARTIARALRLNEDLTEAIALGHDLGHTPFGHAGERALNSVLEGGFRHYEQSLRVVDKLEKQGRGLNLTREVRNGILCHTNLTADTLEGRVVRFSDRIAYMNHDIDDSVKAGIICEGDIPANLRAVLGSSKSERINTMVGAVIEASGSDILMAEPCKSAFDELHKFLFASVYTNPDAKGEEKKAYDLVITLFEYYAAHTDSLPPEYRKIAELEGAARAAADYVAGMSDHYALRAFEELFIPKSWMVL
ncbi:MAG: deoxyguanosinetriphosphate triphosphohydrolase [Acutalibacteraceae bacterium]